MRRIIELWMFSFNDNKNGKYKVLCKNTGKVILVKNYSNNLLHGEYVYYWDNGQIRVTGQYDQMKRVGSWKTYSPNGNLILEENYDSHSNEDAKQLVLLPI